MEKKPISIFYKNIITTVSDIFDVYLLFLIKSNKDFDQNIVDALLYDVGQFLVRKNIDFKILNENLSFTLINHKKKGLLLKGNNLLSNLWIIDIYPENPNELVNKNEYKNGDFVYKFYTKNKNFSINKIKNNERNIRINQ
jgi:hypothetical protein